MTVMTDAFKKIFLGLGGNPKELAENNDVGDYIVDLENAIKAYVASQISEVPSQVQSDWNQSDDTKADYIKNKPTATGPSTIYFEYGEEVTAEKIASTLDVLGKGGQVLFCNDAWNMYYPSYHYCPTAKISVKDFITNPTPNTRMVFYYEIFNNDGVKDNVTRSMNSIAIVYSADSEWSINIY